MCKMFMENMYHDKAMHGLSKNFYTKTNVQFFFPQTFSSTIMLLLALFKVIRKKKKLSNNR